MIKRCSNMRHHGNGMRCLENPVGLGLRAHKAKSGVQTYLLPSPCIHMLLLELPPTTPTPLIPHQSSFLSLTRLLAKI